MKIFNNDKVLPYTLLRLTMGINIFLHGAVRLPKLSSFVNWMQGLYAESILPAFSIQVMGYAIPILEVLIGLLIIIGLFTRKAYLAGSILILVLITGSCLIEKWDWAGIQMVYALFYFCLFHFIEYNDQSLDKLLRLKS